MTGPLPPPTRTPVPRVVAGRYRLLRPLGRGGMATVHRAHDDVLDRAVAIKLLHPHLAGDERVLDRFRREARAAAALQHPGVVAVYDWGVDGELPYLVMELVEGRSLRHVLDLRGRLRPGEALALLGPATAGLAAAHAAGIVHRDVTPSNILVAPDGASKLGDFGLARSVAATTATFAEGIVGSPHYLSPEAARGERLDARADVYSLGCVLFECLTGRPPFEGDSPVAIASQHGSSAVPAPSTFAGGIAPPLDEVVARATAADREARTADAAASARGLSSAVPEGPSQVDLRDGSTTIVVLPEHATSQLDELGATTVTPVPGRRRPRWRRVLAVLVALALLAGGGWVAWDRVVAPVTAVPEVVGLTLADARELLTGAGFRVRVVDDRAFSRTVPEGSVVSQSPTEPTRTTTAVELVVSAGPREGELPPLVGREAVDARAAVEELGLDLTIEVVDGFDDDVPAGTVLAADPAGGSTVTEGSAVTLTVSRGPAPVDVPEVVGLLEGAATAELVNAGLVASIEERRYDDAPAGTVVAATPPVGTEVRRGDEVRLTVSDGPEPVEVPDVEGMREARAITTLEQAGFVVDVRYVRTLLPFAAGIVDAQDPAPGSVRPRGETVRIFVWD